MSEQQKISNISKSNDIPLNLAIAELAVHLNTVIETCNEYKDNPELLKDYQEDIARTTEKLSEILQKRKECQHDKAPKTPPDKVPWWWGDELNRPDEKCEVRGTPNVFLRSALFSIDKDDQSVLAAKEIRCASPYSMRYTGNRLHQSDLDLWQTILHFARGHCFDDELIMTRNDIFEILNRSRSGKAIAHIEARLEILASCKLEIWDIKSGEYLFNGALLQSFKRIKNKQSVKYHIVVGDIMRELFRYDRFTHVNWQVRDGLNGKFLAQWIHGYISTHAKVFPHSFQYYKLLSGSLAKDVWRFKATLLNALDELLDINEKYKISFGYDLKTIREPKITRRRQSTKVIQLPVAKQLLTISHQPSEIQRVALFMREQAKKRAEQQSAKKRKAAS